MTIAALDPADPRSVQARVAGPTALLIAKAHKLHDRVASSRKDRLDDKDAADVLRLMQTFDPATIGAVFATLDKEPVAAGPAKNALDYIEQLFGRRAGVGVEMAARALRTAMPEDRVEVLSTAYVAALRLALGR
jgi:hypothetical protein